MYLRDLAQRLARRWYLVAVGLIAVAGLCVLVFRLVPPTYEARANLLLLPSETASQDGGNPFLLLGGLAQPLDVMTRTMDATTTRTAILGKDSPEDYVVEPDPLSKSPILTVLATAPTEEGALEVLGAVISQAFTTLDQVQSELEVAQEDRITMMQLTVDDHAEVDTKDQIRALVAVGAGGIAGVALLTGLLDSLLMNNRQRRLTTESDDDTPVSTAPAEDAPTRMRQRRSSLVDSDVR